MALRIRWLILGILLFAAGLAWAVLDLREPADAPSPLLIELAKARGYIEATVSRRPPRLIREVIREQLPAEEAEPLFYARFGGDFEEPEPPEVEFGGVTFGGDCPVELPPVEPLPEVIAPNWTLRPGDLTGSCMVTGIRGRSRPLFKIEQLVRAQTPDGIVQRELEPREGQVDAWASSAPAVRRWQATASLDVLVPLDLERPTLAVLGASWWRAGKRLGWSARVGYGAGGDELVQLFDDDATFRVDRSSWYAGGGLTWRIRK